MIKKKKIIYVTDHLFSKKNFYNLKKYKKKFNIIFNEYKKPLRDIDLIKIFKKYPDISGVIAGLESYNSKTLENSKSLKVISRVGVGIDSLDQKYLGIKKVKIIKLTNELSSSVAELFLTLILNSLRKISENKNLLKKGFWKPIIGNNLTNKNIGIIGYGKIGKKLNQYLKTFNCNILIFEKKKNLKIRKYTLKKIFNKCDLVCVALSLNNSTKEIINKNVLKKANKKIIIINASRGAIINEKHLLEFLKKNKNASAVLDCFTKEPYKGVLLKQKNVFPTPHIASFTQETRLKMEYSASKNIIKYLEKID